MALIKEYLQADLNTADEKGFQIKLDDPVDNLDAETASAAWEDIVGLGVLQNSKGSPAIGLKKLCRYQLSMEQII